MTKHNILTTERWYDYLSTCKWVGNKQQVHICLKIDVRSMKIKRNEFEKDPIDMAWLLGQSIFKTTAFVGCSRSAVVRIY